MPESESPNCGLYQTGEAMRDHPEQVPESRLVYFHNHSRQGPPIVLLPHHNHYNRWHFSERGFLVKDDDAFVGGLRPLPAEGFYTLDAPIKISDEVTLPPRTLVQLGYNREATPLLFVGRLDGATIRFPETGYRFDAEIFRHLRPGAFRVLPAVQREGVH